MFHLVGVWFVFGFLDCLTTLIAVRQRVLGRSRLRQQVVVLSLCSDDVLCLRTGQTGAHFFRDEGFQILRANGGLWRGFGGV